VVGKADRLGIEEQRARMAMAWVAEKAVRLKPNGRLGGYSPLSRVLASTSASSPSALRLSVTWSRNSGCGPLKRH